MGNLYKLLLLALSFLCFVSPLYAQQPTQLIADLEAIDNTIKSTTCANQQVLSNRAMNLFLADKIGSYLTDYKDLSFYKNYITLNTRDGFFSLNHNFFQASGLDESIRSFYVVGVRANVFNALASTFLDKSFTNELGATFKMAWMGKPKTIINDCRDKNLMDAKRALILNKLKHEIAQREAALTQSIDSIKQEGLPDSTFARLKASMKQDFYASLSDEFQLKFATRQYLDLAETAHYKRISTHWTTLNAYIPVVLQRFTIAKSFSDVIETKKSYPFELSLAHTRFWESGKAGRVLLTLEARLSLNNSVQGEPGKNLTYDQYKSAGGIDTLLLKQRVMASIFVGDYSSFLTPGVRMNVVYYPPSSHIGISTALDQSIGKYNTLNWTLGIPIVLIDKAGAPSANFEFRLNYTDLTHSLQPTQKSIDHMSISLAVAVPFSKIIY